MYDNGCSSIKEEEREEGKGREETEETEETEGDKGIKAKLGFKEEVEVEEGIEAETAKSFFFLSFKESELNKFKESVNSFCFETVDDSFTCGSFTCCSSLFFFIFSKNSFRSLMESIAGFNRFFCVFECLLGFINVGLI